MNILEEIFKESFTFLFILFVFALIIDKILLILRSIFMFQDYHLKWYIYWTKKAYYLRYKFEKILHQFYDVDPRMTPSIFFYHRNKFLQSQRNYTGTIPILSGDLVRFATLKSYEMIISIILGVFFAYAFKVDLLKIWEKTVLQFSGWNIDHDIWLCYLISGIILGIGAAVLRSFRTTIE